MRIQPDNPNLSFRLAKASFRLQRIVLDSIDHPIPLHSHGMGCFELHYILSGSGTIVCNGVSHPIGPDTFYLTGPFVEHSQISQPDNPMKEYCIYLKVSPPRNALPAASEDETAAFLQSFLNTGSCLIHPAREFGGLMEDIFIELKEQRPGCSIQIEAKFKELLVLMVRSRSPILQLQKKALSPVQDKTFITIDEYFLYEYKNLSLEELAKRLSLSCRQTERLLKGYYGKTFQQKKADARMAAAAVLLEKQISVTETAEELGYSSIEHFSSAFKKYYGVSPRTYRQKEAANHPPHLQAFLQ